MRFVEPLTNIYLAVIATFAAFNTDYVHFAHIVVDCAAWLNANTAALYGTW